MFYNRFVSRVEALENRYINFIDEFATILNRRLVTVRSQQNRNNQAKEFNEQSFKHQPQEQYQNHQFSQGSQYAHFQRQNDFQQAQYQQQYKREQ